MPRWTLGLSVFLRDCKDCKIVSASQQLRLRNCKDVDCSIYSATQPVIETSSNIRLSCFNASFQGMHLLFSKAGLDVLTNCWDQVYDFNAGGTNYAIVSEIPIEYHTEYPYDSGVFPQTIRHATTWRVVVFFGQEPLEWILQHKVVSSGHKKLTWTLDTLESVWRGSFKDVAKNFQGCHLVRVNEGVALPQVSHPVYVVTDGLLDGVFK